MHHPNRLTGRHIRAIQLCAEGWTYKAIALKVPRDPTQVAIDAANHRPVLTGPVAGTAIGRIIKIGIEEMAHRLNLSLQGKTTKARAREVLAVWKDNRRERPPLSDKQIIELLKKNFEELNDTIEHAIESLAARTAPGRTTGAPLLYFQRAKRVIAQLQDIPKQFH